MEQTLSKEGAPKPENIVPKIKSGQVTTLVIWGDELDSYLKAGLGTGFKVKQIAEVGKKFPYLFMKYNEKGQREPVYDRDGTKKVSYLKVQGRGYIAVSIEAPEGSVSHNPFWDYLKDEVLRKNKA